MGLRLSTCRITTSSTKSSFCSPILTMKDQSRLLWTVGIFLFFYLVFNESSALLYLALYFQRSFFSLGCLVKVFSDLKKKNVLFPGLKPGQRKVLFTCLKRNDKREVKVAQLAGSVAEMSAYHHGEVP